MPALIALQENGTRVKALESRPLLMSGLQFYMDAYGELQADRPIGFSVGLIPWTSCVNWCKINGICDINEIDTFIKYIRALEKIDNDFAERKNKKHGK